MNYDIAISFAGEDREIASQIASLLKKRNISVFYDDYEKHKLWGVNLYDHLSDVYKNKAKYCLMIISQNYANKNWTNLERENAQARAFEENKEYILPLRLDNTEIPGLPKTIGYLSLRENSIENIVNIIELKLNESSDPIMQPQQEKTKIRIPNIKKEFSERKQDIFLDETFKFIKNYFHQASAALRKDYPEIDIDIIDVHNFKFLVRLYKAEKSINNCKIWLSRNFRRKQILISEGDFSIDNDNSHIGGLSVAINDNNLCLESDIFGYNNFDMNEKYLSKEKAAEYFWLRFLKPLEY